MGTKKNDFMENANISFIEQFSILEGMPDFIRKDMADSGEFDEEKFYEELPWTPTPEDLRP
ncbi:MAG: hypothetical protein IKW58_03810 [Alphaproteobacteria bacterium]|nr:hypothetical protein [Alphaproteobacteria bacterium]